MKRLAFVDALRGLAVAGMLVIHQSEWWLTPVARRTETFATLYFISKLVAPVFLTLAGVSLALRFGGRPKGWVDLRPVLSRGLKILALGYVFNLAVWVPVWGLEEIASWDILQLIGLAIIVCGLLLPMTPWWARLIVALGMAWLSTVLVRRHMDFLPAYLADVVYGRTPLFIYTLHHLVGYALFYFLGWHDRFGFPAAALLLLASFVVIYLTLYRCNNGSLRMKKLWVDILRAEGGTYG